MQRGSLLATPNGYQALVSGIDYYLIANANSLAHIALAWFTENDRQDKSSDRWRADIVRIDRSAFETGVEAGLIIAKENDKTFPPWLSWLEGLDPDALEESRVSKKTSYREYASGRYQHIAPLVEKEAEFFAEADIYKAFSAHAKACNPRQHPDRVRLWYCAFQAFGQDLYALSPAFPGVGTWDRKKLADPSKKLGRPNLKNGPNSGYSAIPLAPRIHAAYLKYAEPGKHMTDIHADALSYEFGCKTGRDKNGNVYYFHPENAPFPTSSQFDYHVKQRFGLESIQRQKYGDTRYRSRIAPSKGKFSEATANLLESIEADAYYLKERPTRLLSNEPGLPLSICRIACATSGYIAGIGFSYGGERAEAYRAAMFFAVAPKDLMARMFALDISDDDFPCTGMSPKYISDRGPGHNAVAVMADDDKPAISDLSPSWMGQSKATVESSHPRDVKQEGAPSYIQSDLNMFELARREIQRAGLDNKASNASARLTPEMIAAKTPANPNGIARYLIGRGRVDVVSMRLDRAIRSFLTKVTLELDASGLCLHGLRYDSAAYRASGLDRLPRGRQRLPVLGYLLPMTVRIVWIEHEGRLIEIEGQLPIRDDPRQLHLSLAELEQTSGELKELLKDQRENAAASKVDARNRFMEATGKQWDAGKRIAGRAPARAGRGRSDVPTQFPARKRSQ